MKEKILNWAVLWLASFVTEESVKEWMETARKVAVPWLEKTRLEILAKLAPKVQDSETKIDDAGLKAFEVASAEIISWLKKSSEKTS